LPVGRHLTGFRGKYEFDSSTPAFRQRRRGDRSFSADALLQVLEAQRLLRIAAQHVPIGEP
jgi:hypothetical protein